MTETHPLAPSTVKGRVRARMWEDALAAHEAGRVRATEVRASDFIGPGAYSVFTLMVGPQVLAGEPTVVPADLNAPHTWTFNGDSATALVAASRDDRAWGKAWHVPSGPPVSLRELTIRFSELAGAPSPELVVMSAEELERATAADPVVAEFPEMQYALRRPWILDSSLTQTTFGLDPTPLDEALLSMGPELAAAV